jgi:hypothetical protein
MNAMKANKVNETASPNPGKTVCFASCRKLDAAVHELKRSIVEEFQARVPAHGRMIESAVNEAEALAWQTPFPHLFFPALAREKAAAATRWAARQESMQTNLALRALAA